MQLVSRTASILRALEGRSVGLSLGQIAKSTDLARATVQRIVDALIAERFVAPDLVHGGVRLGPALVRMAASAYADFRAIARPHIETLSREVSETIVLAVMRDWKAVYVDQVIADRAMQVTTKPGSELPLHSTAAGKAMLATQPTEIIERVIRGPLEQVTAQTVLSPTEVTAQIAEAGQTTFGYDIEETTEGVCAIATPVRDVLSAVYSISITTPTGRFRPNLDLFRMQLAECRRQIEAAAGTGEDDIIRPGEMLSRPQCGVRERGPSAD